MICIFGLFVVYNEILIRYISLCLRFLCLLTFPFFVLFNFTYNQPKPGMAPGSSGPLPPPGAPGAPQSAGAHISSGSGITVPSKPGVMSNSSRPQTPQVSTIYRCPITKRFACFKLFSPYKLVRVDRLISLHLNW